MYLAVANEFLACMKIRDVVPCKLTNDTHVKCTGFILTNTHSSLLNILISELLVKVAPRVYPDFDTRYFKSKQGKKNHTKNSVTTKKAKFDVILINNLN